MKISIPHRPIHIALFLLLGFLCYQAHQLTRHLVGAGLCGSFGSMTFAVATTRQPCSLPMIVILSGPILTFGLEWLGMFLLRSTKHMLFAYALIFASFAPLRFIQTLSGRGDELILAQEWLGISSREIVALAVLLLGIPPIVMAFRVIADKRRVLVWICSLLLPLPLLIVMLLGDGFLFGTNDFPYGSHIGLRAASLLGISLIVLVTDLLAGILFVMRGWREFFIYDKEG